MAHVIAVAGKGGVGKTTLTGLIIRIWVKRARVLFLRLMQMQIQT